MERAELRWKLRLREKATLVWARLMDQMLKVGKIASRVERELYGIVLQFADFRYDSGLT